MSTNKDISGHMMCLLHVHFVSDTRDPALSSKGYVVEMWACPLNKDIYGHVMCLSNVHFVSDTRDPALSSKGYVVEMWACPLIRTSLDI